MGKLPLLSLSCLFMLLHGTAGGQWIKTNGPYGGNIRCLAVSGTNLFAGTAAAGIFRSTDNGANWTQMNSGLTNLNVRTLSFNASGHIFSGTNGGVFRSPAEKSNLILRSPSLKQIYRQLPKVFSACRMHFRRAPELNLPTESKQGK